MNPALLPDSLADRRRRHRPVVQESEYLFANRRMNDLRYSPKRETYLSVGRACSRRFSSSTFSRYPLTEHLRKRGLAIEAVDAPQDLVIIEEERPVCQSADQMIAPKILNHSGFPHTEQYIKDSLLYQSGMSYYINKLTLLARDVALAADKAVRTHMTTRVMRVHAVGAHGDGTGDGLGTAAMVLGHHDLADEPVSP